jgi:large subunit ribosomal protein L17
MRHLKSGRKLKRTASHRKATLAALGTSLIVYKRIKTTLAKAKETRMYVEKIITRAKNAVAQEAGTDKKNIAARREVFSILRSKAAVAELFKEIAPKVASRAGGYTRVVKLGRRLGDGAEVAMLELVDFNVGQDKNAAKAAKKSVARKKQMPKKKTAKNTTAEENVRQPESAPGISTPDAGAVNAETTKDS